MATVFDMTRDLAPQLTIHIRIEGMGRWGMRLKVASPFFKIAAKIMNCRIEFDGVHSK